MSKRKKITKDINDKLVRNELTCEEIKDLYLLYASKKYKRTAFSKDLSNFQIRLIIKKLQKAFDECYGYTALAKKSRALQPPLFFNPLKEEGIEEEEE